jgi:hypothetical protein
VSTTNNNNNNMMLKLIALLPCLVTIVRAIPINNGVQGDPEIECGPTSISVTFNTQNNFEGHVYVKGLFDQKDAGCRTSGDGSRAVGQIELPFDKCSVNRRRSANPKGIFVSTTVVITFHPNFMTKVDRAYTLQCFYMEADKTVSTNIEVSEITTGFQTQTVPMPVCRYEILSAATDGEPVRFAIIGQGVFHKWTCDTETVDTFCMRVYSCFVVDPTGNDRLDLINEAGCANDKYLMGNLEYPTDLMAVREVHVFKYADRPALFFQCQIEIAVKEPNGNCAEQTQPKCEVPKGAGDGNPNERRKRRAANQSQAPPAALIDVDARLETLELDDQVSTLPSDLAHRVPAPRQLYAPVAVYRDQDGVCMSTGGFAAFLTIAVALIAAVVTVASCLLFRREK